MSYISPIDVYTDEDLKSLIKSDKTIKRPVTIRGQYVTEIRGVEKIKGTLGISESMIESFGNLKEVRGDIWFSFTLISPVFNDLGDLEKVGGNLILRQLQIKSLGKLKRVGGNLNLRSVPLEDLGCLEYVGGDLILHKNLEGKFDFSGIKVGGKIKFINDRKNQYHPSAQAETKLAQSDMPVPLWRKVYSFSSEILEIADKEQREFYDYFKNKFLKDEPVDIKGNSNYAFALMFEMLESYDEHPDLTLLERQIDLIGATYPVIKRYAHDHLMRIKADRGELEKAWEMQLAVESGLPYEDVFLWQQKLGRNIFDEKLIVKLAGTGHLTELGQNNIDEISVIAINLLKEFEAANGRSFLDNFFQTRTVSNDGDHDCEEGDESYLDDEVLEPKAESEGDLEDFISQVKVTVTWSKPKIVRRELFDRNIEVIPLTIDREYYRKFYFSEEKYNFAETIDDQQLGQHYQRQIPHVVEKAIHSQLQLFLHEAEKSFRESNGLPRIGEGWISETELFYKISNSFPSQEFIHHGKPNWLGKQHLDIYAPQLGLAIEYQGRQHYEAVDFFGGQEALAKSLERDERKRQICEENNCILLYVYEGYDFEEVKLEIENLISSSVVKYKSKHINKPF